MTLGDILGEKWESSGGKVDTGIDVTGREEMWVIFRSGTKFLVMVPLP